MKIFLPAARVGAHTMYVAPAAEDPSAGVPEWWTVKDNGDRVPLSMPVRFVNGMAEVPDNLGRFLINRGHARKTRPLLAA